MKKVFLSVGLILFLAAGCADKITTENLPPNLNIPDSNTQPAYAPAQASSSSKKIQKPVFDNKKSEDSPTSIKVAQKLPGLSETIFSVVQDTTALDLLKSGHKVETKSYGSLGDMVLGIDGKNADNKNFWEFFVNGKSSNIGAGSYKIQNGDSLEWKFSTIKLGE